MRNLWKVRNATAISVLPGGNHLKDDTQTRPSSNNFTTSTNLSSLWESDFSLNTSTHTAQKARRSSFKAFKASGSNKHG
ncbi:hypothetical protein Lal_00029198 [Lupinus albus]|nr:hypothetical protein Lal_00029198 [Lupinus albus]